MPKCIIVEEENGVQPFVVYTVTGRKKEWRAAFSTRESAEIWIAKYGDRDVRGPGG